MTCLLADGLLLLLLPAAVSSPPPFNPSSPPPQGYEVMYMTDVLDEYVMGQLTEFEDFKFANIAKEDLDMTGGAEKDDKVGGPAVTEFCDRITGRQTGWQAGRHTDKQHDSFVPMGSRCCRGLWCY
jgi:hypothetical protein